jgi:hypothetical protein
MKNEFPRTFDPRQVDELKKMLGCCEDKVGRCNYE